MKNYKVKVVLDPPGVAKEGIVREGPLTPEHVSQLGPRFNAMMDEAQHMADDTKVIIEVELSDEAGAVTSTLVAETTKGDILMVKSVLDTIDQMVAADNGQPAIPAVEEPMPAEPIETPEGTVEPKETSTAPEGDEQAEKQTPAQE